MALKTILDDLSEAPESIQSEYKEQKAGDKTVYVLDLEGVDAHPAVVNLKTAHERVKADKAKLANDLRDTSTKLAGVPEDFDPDEWARLRAEEEARKNDPEGKDVRAQIETAVSAVRTQLETKLERRKKDADAKLAEKDQAITELDGELRRMLVGDGLRAALTTAGVKKGLIPAAVALFERDVEVISEEGRRVARMKADLGGDEVERYISNWAQSDEAKDYLDIPTGPAPEGSRNGRLGDSASNPFGKTGWSKTAQASLVRENRAKAEQLAKAAGFKTLEQTFAAVGPAVAA